METASLPATGKRSPFAFLRAILRRRADWLAATAERESGRMLKLCRKGDYLTAVPLSAAEDEAMRKAFGRFASVAGRRAGTEIVQRYQHQGHGNWFLCDCLDGVETRPPALVPVMESFIRRHTDPPWPAHAEDCEFFREPGEQKAITNSYGPPSPGPLRLVRRYGQAESAALEREVYRSYAWRREGLATMLRLLQIKSGLNRLTTASSRPKLGDQYRLLRAAAGEIEIDDNLHLSRFLCTYAPAMPEFMAKVGAAPARQFKNTRPHGIFLTIINGVGDGQLLVSEGQTVPVRGRISMFGERDGYRRETVAERSARAPYLAACLVARPKTADPVCVMKAYVHPCASSCDLMLVDSNYERQTLAELKRLQQFLSRKQSIRMVIEKPMLDIRSAEDFDDPAIAAREPCIPDFILRSGSVPDGGAPVVVVETIGFASETYRSRKAVTHEIMASTLNAPVLTHDFHFPETRTQPERDRRFWGRFGIRAKSGHKPKLPLSEKAYLPGRRMSFAIKLKTHAFLAAIGSTISGQPEELSKTGGLPRRLDGTAARASR